MDNTLRSTIAIGNGTFVLIDGGGAKILTDTQAFSVKEGATLCFVNAVIDGQQLGRGVRAAGTGTTLRFEDVTFQQCNATVPIPTTPTNHNV